VTVQFELALREVSSARDFSLLNSQLGFDRSCDAASGAEGIIRLRHFGREV
jgi:hypothetical protein